MGLLEMLCRVAGQFAMQPDVALGAGLLLAAAVVVVFAAGLLVAAPAASASAALRVDRFARVRVLLRSSDPSAAGHRRSRAPGGTS